MTSNLGSESILENQENSHELVLNELKSHFRPEFINRIDEIIIFKALSKEVMNQILDKILREIEKRLEPSNIKLELSMKAREQIVEESYDASYGARPVKRYVTKHIETILSNLILEDKVNFNDTLTIDYLNGKYNIDVKDKKEI